MTTGRINQVTPSSRTQRAWTAPAPPRHAPQARREARRNHTSQPRFGDARPRQRAQPKTTALRPTLPRRERATASLGMLPIANSANPQGAPLARNRDDGHGRDGRGPPLGNPRRPRALRPRAAREPVHFDRTMARGHSPTRANGSRPKEAAFARLKTPAPRAACAAPRKTTPFAIGRHYPRLETERVCRPTTGGPGAQVRHERTVNSEPEARGAARPRPRGLEYPEARAPDAPHFDWEQKTCGRGDARAVPVEGGTAS
jgi:hypothetical protein